MQNEVVKSNFRDSVFKKYGVYHPMQCISISSKNIKSGEEFVEMLYENYGNDYVSSTEYRTWNYPLDITHIRCNNTYKVKPTRIQEKSWRCPNCFPRNVSKGELYIEDFLNKYQLSFRKEVVFSECRNEKSLRFDFCMDYSNLCIEYDGQQHFFPVDFIFNNKFKGAENNLGRTKVNDKIKNQYCIDNNIPLIRIPYWEFDNIEYILTSALSYYNLLNSEEEYDKELFKEFLVDENWVHDDYIARCPKNIKEEKRR